MLTLQSLTRMTEQAMRERAPRTYAELSRRGKLMEVCRERAAAALEVADGLKEDARDRAATSRDKNVMQRVQGQMRRNRTAEETAIAQATEFPSEEETTSSPPLDT
jgi:hypothetical protein